MLVIDSDEFLYCRGGGPTKQGQKQYINKILDEHSFSNFDQINLVQKLINPTTNNPLECMKNKISLKESIFQCFTSINDVLALQQFKSFHLRHVCPLTDYHGSCNHDSVHPLNDCLCENNHLENCAIYHISTNNEKYGSKTISAAGLGMRNEIFRVLQS